MKYKTFIEFPVKVNYTFHPACPGSISEGRKMEPDEPAWCEVEERAKIILGDTHAYFYLTENQMRDIEEDLMEVNAYVDEAR